MKKQQRKGGIRKHGRDLVKCAKYRSEGRRERNKARKKAKEEKHQARLKARKYGKRKNISYIRQIP